MKRTRLALVLFGLCATVAAGCSDSGIGAPCTPGTGTGNLRVLVTAGECTTGVCVSYVTNVGYRTIECATNAECPSPGYICCPVVQTGEMTSCTTDNDCTTRQRCRQNQCKPKQFCVQGTGVCQ